MLPSAKSEGYTDRHLEFKIYLLRRGISQRQLAKQLKVTVSHLNHVLRGRKGCMDLRRRMVEQFGIPADLVGYSTPKEPKAA